jgi:hypothetical protein
LGTPLAKNRPASSAKLIVGLRLKLERMKDRLLFTKTHSTSSLPDLPWQRENLKNLSVLVDAVYMASHKHSGTTGGNELRWVDRNYKNLRLFIE